MSKFAAVFVFVFLTLSVALLSAVCYELGVKDGVRQEKIDRLEQERKYMEQLQHEEERKSPFWI